MATATLKKHLECPVCFEVFCNPHMLQCLHTYCLECLEPLQKDGEQIECPECRQITHLKDLEKDSRVEGMVEFFEQLKKGITEDIIRQSLHDTSSIMKCVCNNLNKPVVCHCEDCEEYLCSDCKAAHENLKLTRTHKIRNISDRMTTLKQDLHKASDEMHAEVKAINKMSTEIDNKIENVRLDEKDKLAEVNNVLDLLIEDIEKHRITLVNKITEAGDPWVKKLSAYQEQLMSNRLVLQSWLEYLRDSSTSDNMATLSEVNTLHKTIMAGKASDIAEIKHDIAKMSIARRSHIRLAKSKVFHLKNIRIMTVDVDNADYVSVEAPGKKRNGFHALINCKYKQIESQYYPNNGKAPSTLCMINEQFWCSFSDMIRVLDKNFEVVKKIPHKELEEVRGISYAWWTGDVIVSCDNGLHELDMAGNYVKKLKEGSFGSIFSFGRKLYVVDPSDCKILILQNVHDQWVGTEEMSLACPYIDARNQMIVRKSGIYITSFENHCVYHYNYKGELQEIVDVAAPRSDATPGLIGLLGVDSYGNMLIVDELYETVQLYTSEQKWLNVPFLEEINAELVWQQRYDVWVVTNSNNFLRFTQGSQE